MKKYSNDQLSKNLMKDIFRTVAGLYSKELVLDVNMPSEKEGNGYIEITYSGKTSEKNILFDENASSDTIFDVLLKNNEYSILLYDKSIIQAEYLISDGRITKGRLLFMKRHNRKWSLEEISEMEEYEDSDWWKSQEGIPIVLRLDYDPDSFKEQYHSATHFTFSNCKSCRIPVRRLIPFSKFVKFILFHFYDIDFSVIPTEIMEDDTITELERKMIHFDWLD